MKDSKGRTTGILYLTALAVLWALLHYRVLFLGHTFMLKDASNLFYPLWAWGAGVFQGGRIPLWNPDAAFGTPYVSDPETAVWYPPLRLFYFLPNPVDAFRFCLAIHHLFGLVGFYLYGRVRNFSPTAAFTGALFFGFSIHAVSSPACSPLVFVFSWIPWIFLCAERFWMDRRGGWLFLSISLAMQMAAGYPIVTYLTLLVLGTERLATGDWRNPRFWKKNVWFLTALLPVVLFNLSWLLPFAEFRPFSNLSQRLEMREGLPSVALLTWFNPFQLSHPLHSGETYLFELSSFFIGLPALGLTLWALVRRKVGWTEISLLALWVCLAQIEWMGRLAGEIIPFYKLVARSGYWTPLLVFVGAKLAAGLVDQALAGEKSKRIDVLWFGAGGMVFAAAMACGVPVDLWSFWIALILFSLAGLSATLPLFARRVCLIGAALFSLGPAAQGVHFTLGKDYFEKPPAAAAKMEKPGRIYESYSVMEKLQTVSGDSVRDSYGKIKESMASNWPLVFGKEECFFYESFFISRFFDWNFSSMRVSEVLSRKNLDYLNIRYLLGDHRFAGFKRLGETPVALSENLQPLEKWTSVIRAYPQTDWASDLGKAAGPGFDFRNDCFLSGGEGKTAYSRRTVRSLGREPGEVRLEAQGKGRALLASSETAYPGWRAFAGEKEIPVLEVNHGFRGLALAEGQEKIRLVYRPTAFKLGCFLSLLICGLWAFGLLSLRGRPAANP
jgi:hypothetical protein